MKEKAILLFANCIPVEGASRSTICDVQRQIFHLIPNGLYEIVTVHRGKTVSEIKKAYDNEIDEILEEYFDFLLDKELAFYTDEPELFPEIDMAARFPSVVQNAILDINKDSDHPYEKIFGELEALGCIALQVRIFYAMPLDELSGILSYCKDSRLNHLDIITQYYDGVEKAANMLVEDHPRINNILLHSSPKDRYDIVEVQKSEQAIIYYTDVIDSDAHCGIIHPSHFSINIDHFKEARHFNSCLQGKISVDARGEIRNCPSMPQGFGHISSTSLQEALEKKQFKKYWDVNKDQIKICQDCEFRYICTDCRAFVQNPEDDLSKPAKCSYNPYETVWENPEDDPRDKNYVRNFEEEEEPSLKD